MSLLIQVNCNKELVSTYCTDERLLHRAFLFRYTVLTRTIHEAKKPQPQIIESVKRFVYAVTLCFPVRGGKEFLSFDLDILFDVNSIVSEILL